MSHGISRCVNLTSRFVFASEVVLNSRYSKRENDGTALAPSTKGVLLGIA